MDQGLLELLLLHLEFLLTDQAIFVVRLDRFFVDLLLRMKVLLKFLGFDGKAIHLLVGEDDSLDNPAALAI